MGSGGAGGGKITIAHAGGEPGPPIHSTFTLENLNSQHTKGGFGMIHQLRGAATKAETLQLAQQAMISGKIRI